MSFRPDSSNMKAFQRCGRRQNGENKTNLQFGSEARLGSRDERRQWDKSHHLKQSLWKYLTLMSKNVMRVETLDLF